CSHSSTFLRHLASIAHRSSREARTLRRPIAGDKSVVVQVLLPDRVLLELAAGIDRDRCALAGNRTLARQLWRYIAAGCRTGVGLFPLLGRRSDDKRERTKLLCDGDLLDLFRLKLQRNSLRRLTGERIADG